MNAEKLILDAHELKERLRQMAAQLDVFADELSAQVGRLRQELGGVGHDGRRAPEPGRADGSGSETDRESD